MWEHMKQRIYADMLLIFDLDGTLFQAKPVVLSAVLRLFGELDIPVPDEGALMKSAGQMLDAFLRETMPCNANLAKSRELYLALSREEILARGELYPGIREALEHLCADGHELAVCSNSPIEYIQTVLEHTGIAGLFKSYCSTEIYPSKADALRDMANREQRSATGASPPAKRRDRPSAPAAIVIGDTHGDIEAAHENGLTAIAAMYGYGNKDLLADAEHFADSPEEIIRCIREIAGQ